MWVVGKTKKNYMGGGGRAYIITKRIHYKTVKQWSTGREQRKYDYDPDLMIFPGLWKQLAFLVMLPNIWWLNEVTNVKIPQKAGKAL